MSQSKFRNSSVCSPIYSITPQSQGLANGFGLLCYGMACITPSAALVSQTTAMVQRQSADILVRYRTMICHLNSIIAPLGFESGGAVTVVHLNAWAEAMPVGECFPREKIANCTGKRIWDVGARGHVSTGISRGRVRNYLNTDSIERQRVKAHTTMPSSGGYNAFGNFWFDNGICLNDGTGTAQIICNAAEPLGMDCSASCFSFCPFSIFLFYVQT